MFGKVTFTKKKILIYGLGLSGKSCFKYLLNKNKINIFDDNISLRNKKNKIYFLNKNKILQQNFDYIVLSPGIDIKKCKLKNYLLKNKNKIITELDIFYLSYPNNLKLLLQVLMANQQRTRCYMTSSN